MIETTVADLINLLQKFDPDDLVCLAYETSNTQVTEHDLPSHWTRIHSVEQSFEDGSVRIALYAHHEVLIQSKSETE